MHFTGPNLSIRPEIAQDADFLALLYRSTREDLMLSGLPETMMNDLIGMQFRAQQSSYRAQFPDAEYSIIEKDGASIGCLVSDRSSEMLRLVYIALLPHERNRGHGRSLLRAMQSEAANANKALTLSVSTQNTGAQRLYLSSGFQVVRNDSAYLEMVWRQSATPIVAEE